MRDAFSSFGVTPEFVRAVMGVESAGNPNAVSPKGAIGLMQIMPATARGMGIAPEALYDPNTNVQAGTQILNRLLAKYGGDLTKTLEAYNAGEGRVASGRIPAETRKYVGDVLARLGSGQATQGYGDTAARAGQAAAQVSPEIAALGRLWSQFSRAGQAERQRYQQFAGQFAQDPEQAVKAKPGEIAGLQDVAIGASGGIASEAEPVSGVMQALRLADDFDALVAGLTGRQTQPQQTAAQPPPQRQPFLYAGQQAVPNTPSLLARLQSAWGPGTAQAAEGPPSAGPPSLDDIKRDKARRAAAATPPALGEDDLSKLSPFQRKVVGAAGWAPAVGQTIGEYGAGGADLPLVLATGGAGAASEPIAMGIGGGAGYGTGELVNRLVRQHYGLPVPTWGQEAKQTGEAGALSAAMVPAWRLLGKLPFVPASLKAGMKVAREEAPQYRAATRAAQETGTTLQRKLDMTGAQAAQMSGKWLETIRQVPKRAADLLAALDKNVRNLGPQDSAVAYNKLRDGVSSIIIRAGEGANSQLEGLVRMRQTITAMPSHVIKRLYNMSPRELTEVIDTTINEHGRWLSRPDLTDALRNAIESTPYNLRQYIGRHMDWARHWMIFKFFVNPIGALKDLFGVELGGRTIIGGSKIVNSPIMRRMYLNLLKAQTPHQVRLLGRALINALATHDMMHWNQGQQPAEPEAAPEPAARATPSAPARPPSFAEEHPAVPSGPEASTQEIEPPEPPPTYRDMPTWMSTE